MTSEETTESMKISLTSSIFVILYICTGLITNLGAIDILGPQWVYLGTMNFLSLLFFFIYPPRKSLFKLLSTLLFWIYAGLMVWAFLSYFWAINQTVTIINLPRYYNVFFAGIFAFLHIERISNKINFVVGVLSAFLCMELIFFFSDFLEYLSLDKGNIGNVKGISANKNIGAASIAMKIPFLIYLISRSSKIWIRLFSIVVLTMAFFAISVVNARAAILSSSLIVVLFLGVMSYLYFKKKEIVLKELLVKIGLVILPFVLSFIMNAILSQSSKAPSVARAIANIEFTEKSSNGRFQYWSDVFEGFKDHPILGSGLGNWKIASIHYGKEHIKGYTVPYHAHNDFLHFAAELGILGFLGYSSLFVILAIYLFRIFRVNKEYRLLAIGLLLSFFAYVVDSSLNFPIARPLMQSSFALIFGLSLSLYFTTNRKREEEEKLPLSKTRLFLGISILFVVAGTTVHAISYNSLRQQMRVLYEFNAGKFNLTLNDWDDIYDDFPNITETAMPIKSIKSRYYFLKGKKEMAYKLIREGGKANPTIGFSDNMLGNYFLEDKQWDSAYYYSKRAFDKLPNNKSHFQLYIKMLSMRKDVEKINETFDYAKRIMKNDLYVWQIYLKSLISATSFQDLSTRVKIEEAYNLYPKDKAIFSIYRIANFGEAVVVRGDKLFQEGNALLKKEKYDEAIIKFKEAISLDSLESSYPLSLGVTYIKKNDFENAILYLDKVLANKNTPFILDATRYKAYSLYSINRGEEACKLFRKLSLTKKRIYVQEYNKFCVGK